MNRAHLLGLGTVSLAFVMWTMACSSPAPSDNQNGPGGMGPFGGAGASASGGTSGSSGSAGSSGAGTGGSSGSAGSGGSGSGGSGSGGSGTGGGGAGGSGASDAGSEAAGGSAGNDTDGSLPSIDGSVGDGAGRAVDAGSGLEAGGDAARDAAHDGSMSSIAWVGTWSASPYYDSENPPPASLSNSVLRQIAHVSLGGSQIRVQFSNLAGNGPVIIKSAHIATCKASPAVDSSIDTTTDKVLTFAGTETVTIAQGQEVWSDPVAFNVANQGNVSITTAFGSVASNVSGHSGSRTTSYLQTGSSNVSAASMASAQTTDHWYYISGIDVAADTSAKAIVAIGDSITDGRGTDTNKNNRWTDLLAARLAANSATSKLAMMNQGIGATKLVGTSGTAAQVRFSRDVLGQSAVKYVIVLDGVNDIGDGAAFAPMKSAYESLISAAHAKGLLIYGATILPFGDHSFYTADHERVRQEVNTYIKSGVFDGYIDFDAAVTDGGQPPKLQAAYATWAQKDGLHPGPAGYQKMANSVDLTLFTK